MNIIVEQPVLTVDISNKDLYKHVFKCHNIGNPTVVVSKTTGCSCTGLELPLYISEGPFDVTMEIDKRGQSGFYVVKGSISFNNGETIHLQLNGKINDHV